MLDWNTKKRKGLVRFDSAHQLPFQLRYSRSTQQKISKSFTVEIFFSRVLTKFWTLEDNPWVSCKCQLCWAGNHQRDAKKVQSWRGIEETNLEKSKIKTFLVCSRDHLTRVINCYICVAELLPNRGCLFERPLLENCDRERVWNPNRVQFLDVWTELRG